MLPQTGALLLQRLHALHQWVIQTHPAPFEALAPASSDASFRRYFRLTLAHETLIVMDAPPDREDCAPFIHVAELFAQAGLQVPRVLRADLAQGFLLLTDLGHTTYLARFTAPDCTPAEAAQRLQGALGALVSLQRATQPGQLPSYDRSLLQREMDLFSQWYVTHQLQYLLDVTQQKILARSMQLLLDNILAQPVAYVHRDYHSRNLMVLASGTAPGVLDFQDAVLGPITYDAVSLLKDAYVVWSEEQILDALVRYWEQARAAGLPVCADFGEFYRDFEWMGVQRHLKVLGIFSRLYHRDGKAGYLQDLPRVARALHQTCRRYRELQPLAGLLEQLWGEKPQQGYTF